MVASRGGDSGVARARARGVTVSLMLARGATLIQKRAVTLG